MDEAGRVKFIKVAGTHVNMTEDDVKKYIVPYLQDKKRRRLLENGGAKAGDGGAETASAAATTSNQYGVTPINKLENINSGNM